VTTRVTDAQLRLRALEVLGPEGQEIARDALEGGALEVEHDVSSWEGTAGTVRGHRVHVIMDAETLGRVAASMMAQDALSYVIAAALAERHNEALYDLRYEAGDIPSSPGGGPYR
jgi:hypothetical protein